MFTPEVKIKTAQEQTTNKVCPISGWIIRSNEIIEIKIVESRYLARIFNLLLQRIIAKIMIKKGFKSKSFDW